MSAALTVNNPAASGVVRRPRIRVLINNSEVPGCKHAEVTSNGSYQADKYSATFALYADSRFGPAYWGALLPGSLVDVQFALLNPGQPEGSPAGFTSFIIGEVDEMTLNLETGEVAINGRDLTSRFIDTKVANTFKNQTASEIAKTLAAGHGMTADVDATTEMVGRFYSDDHDHLAKDTNAKTQTEWQLLTYFAQQEYPSMDVWVSGTTLHFKNAIVAGSTPSWVVQWGQIIRDKLGGLRLPRSNVNDLNFKRSLTLAKDIMVTVQSHNPKTGKSITKIVKSSAAGGKAGKSSGVSQNVVKQLQSADEATCLRVAKAILEDLTKHERVISWKEPSDLRLSFRTPVQVIGSGSSWDQLYWIDEITRSLSMDGGFTMTVRAKNHSPNSQVTIQ